MFWVGLKKYDGSMRCFNSASTSISSSTSGCNENVTYWGDSAQTWKPTSKFNLGMIFSGDGPNIVIDNGVFQDYNQQTNYLCQKQCRLSGKRFYYLLRFLLKTYSYASK